VTCEATQERGFVVYAYALGAGQRVSGFKKIFPGADVRKVGEFEECERYCRFKAAGQLRTLGEPLRKDVVRGGEARKDENLKRKRCDHCQSLEEEKHQLRDKMRRLQNEKNQLQNENQKMFYQSYLPVP
jgi:hypothetical protein